MVTDGDEVLVVDGALIVGVVVFIVTVHVVVAVMRQENARLKKKNVGFSFFV